MAAVLKLQKKSADDKTVQPYQEKSKFYTYSFNSCSKGLLKSGYNHVVFSLNKDKTDIEMRQAADSKLLATISQDSLVENEKGFQCTYHDLHNDRICRVQIMPCNGEKYQILCPPSSMIIKDWKRLFYNWIRKQENIAAENRTNKAFKDLDRRFPETIALSELDEKWSELQKSLGKKGGKRSKTQKQRSSRKSLIKRTTRKNRHKAQKKQKTRSKHSRNRRSNRRRNKH